MAAQLMGTKRNPGPFDNHAAADFDEPIFTLRASDPVAPVVIRQWAYQQRVRLLNGQGVEGDLDRIADAIATAEAMEAWRRKHRGRG